mgnify:CR=1 FL=1
MTWRQKGHREGGVTGAVTCDVATEGTHIGRARSVRLVESGERGESVGGVRVRGP